MHFQEDYNSSKIRINAWESGTLTINGKKYQENLILTDKEILTLPIPESVELITEENIKEFCNLRPEVLILGTGEKQVFPATTIMETALCNKVAIEVMDTRTACRIFTLLASEGRKILAIFYL